MTRGTVGFWPSPCRALSHWGFPNPERPARGSASHQVRSRSRGPGLPSLRPPRRCLIRAVFRGTLRPSRARLMIRPECGHWHCQRGQMGRSYRGTALGEGGWTPPGSLGPRVGGLVCPGRGYPPRLKVLPSQKEPCGPGLVPTVSWQSDHRGHLRQAPMRPLPGRGQGPQRALLPPASPGHQQPCRLSGWPLAKPAPQPHPRA